MLQTESGAHSVITNLRRLHTLTATNRQTDRPTSVLEIRDSSVETNIAQQGIHQMTMDVRRKATLQDAVDTHTAFVGHSVALWRISIRHIQVRCNISFDECGGREIA